MENKIAIPKGKKVFFASDNHLGAPNINESKIRESHFLKWLNYVDKEVCALFLLGDLFDFWYEYKTVVPKGFVRVLGKIAEISDRGIPVYFFVGNHDQWMINYFEEELGIKVYYQTREFQIEGKTFFIGHGDGLGPNDIGYKIMKKIFRNSFFQTMFRWIHPDIGMKLGHYFSVKNKIISGKRNEKLQKQENNWLIDYAKDRLYNLDFLNFQGVSIDKGGIFSFTMKDNKLHPHDIATIVDQKGVAVRAGHHCAQPLLDHFNLSSTTRASVGAYSTYEDFDRLVLSLEQVKKIFK